MNFNTIGLKQTLVDTIEKAGYKTPTPIQSSAIPAILSGKDLLAAAQTGTGKTAGFTLPLLQLLSERQSTLNPKQVRALVLTPTRELAAQVYESVCSYGRQEGLKAAVVFGGVNMSQQRRDLAQGVDILVATPGRLMDLQQQKLVKLDAVEIFILDEADRMLDMGFIHAIRQIERLLPKVRQNLMFSATFSDTIRTLAKTICRNPVEIDVSPRNSVVKAISQQIYNIPKEQKSSFLSQYLAECKDQALVFSRTKHGADKLAKLLNKANINSVALHGNKSQNQRTKALHDFKQNKAQVLVATDIAARGIDIDQLEIVVNFDMPHVPEDYVHRIGRTGRAGASGLAISLVSPEERKQLHAIERLLNEKIPTADSKYGSTEAVSANEAFEQTGGNAAHDRSTTRQSKSNHSRSRSSRRRGQAGKSMHKNQSSGNEQRPAVAALAKPGAVKRSTFGSRFREMFQAS